MKTIVKIITIIILFLTIVVLVGGYYIGSHLYDAFLDPSTDKSKYVETLAMKDQKLIEWQNWSNGIQYKDVNVESFDHLILHSYLIEQTTKSDVWVIIYHGYGEDATYMTDAAKFFYAQGYSLLLPDARAHGKSEGSAYGMGWYDRLDIIAWIEYINEKYPDQQIILYGFSAGASSILMTTGEDLPDNVKAIISDSAYTTAYDLLDYQFDKIYSFPTFPLIFSMDLVASVQLGYGLKDASSLKQLPKATVPILFIHGEKDTTVPVEMVYKLYEATRSEKELLIIPLADHGETTKDSLYWKSVLTFIQKYITPRSIQETPETVETPE